MVVLAFDLSTSWSAEELHRETLCWERKKKTGKVEVQICIFEVNDEGKANTICPVLWYIDKGRKCLALPKEDDLFEVPVQKMDS